MGASTPRRSEVSNGRAVRQLTRLNKANLSARMGSHVRSPGEWKKLYQFALLETEPATIMGRIADARTAILDRKAELETCHSCDEVRALNDALRFLHILQKEIQTADQSK